MQKIVTAYREGMELNSVTEALNCLSVESACCDIRDIRKVIGDFETEAVFSAGFDRDTAELCYEKGIPYISWVLTSPYPELFVPQILYPTNRIYIAERNLYKIVISSGIRNVFYETAGIMDKRDLRMIGGKVKKSGRAFDARERILFLLDEDEKKYLLGIERAQELYHAKNPFFYGLNGNLVDKIYSGLRLDPERNPVYRRYFVSECLLRQIVKEREKHKVSSFRAGPGERVFCFDDTGVESISAILSGYTVCSDGCGLDGPGLKGDSDYILYEDAAELAYKLERGLPESSGKKNASGLSVKNVIRKMIFL